MQNIQLIISMERIVVNTLYRSKTICSFDKHLDLLHDCTKHFHVMMMVVLERPNILWGGICVKCLRITALALDSYSHLVFIQLEIFHAKLICLPVRVCQPLISWNRAPTQNFPCACTPLLRISCWVSITKEVHWKRFKSFVFIYWESLV